MYAFDRKTVAVAATMTFAAIALASSSAQAQMKHFTDAELMEHLKEIGRASCRERVYSSV